MSMHLEEPAIQNGRAPVERCHLCDGEVIRLSPFGDSPEVIHCQNCHTESLRPLPTAQQLEEYYGNYPATKTPEDQLLYLIELSVKTLNYYLRKTGLSEMSPSSIRFLELGFGNGAGLFAGAKLGLQSYGLDLDPVSIANAQAFAEKHAVRATCMEGEVSALRDMDVEFDLVKASQILEHVLNPLEFLSAISRCQPAGGYLIIECPNNQAAFWRLKNRVRRRFERLDYYNSLKLREHLWGYTRKGLPILAKRAGYRTLFIRDYAAGDAIFEPQSALWYPTLRNGLRDTFRFRAWQPLRYPSVRAFDTLASRLFRRGTGLAALCQKVEGRESRNGQTLRLQ
jgi:SAM-dependent methyltransferase